MIDISIIARDQNLPPEKVQRTIELLDDGNTIPFITRFRKDETGGLNEEQILSIKQQTTSLRALAERKAFVLKSIESQGKLTDKLKIAIDKASTSRALEDAYLPFKPRKKSRAQEARQQGLGPLAEDIFNGTAPEVDLATKATEYVRVDKGLTSVDDVIRGVSDLLAERFADDIELRQELRKVVNETGKLTALSTARDEPEAGKQKSGNEEKVETKSVAMPSSEQAGQAATKTEETASEPVSASEPVASEETVKSLQPADSSSTEADGDKTESDATIAAVAESKPDVEPASDAKAGTESEAKPEAEVKPETEVVADAKAKTPVAAAPAKSKTKKKKKKKRPVDDPYKDYHNFKQPLKKFPHHRVLSINRGERAKKLKVKIECDENRVFELATKKLVPEDHPFADHMKTCVKDALTRLVLPSLEREIRRQMTESAEKHAVEVFANNLRNLLLQPPIRNRRVLAIDPGYKRGCSIAILEKNGDVLHSDHVFVVGNQARRDESRKRVAELVSQYSVDLIAIGNGAACREAEQMISDCIETHLTDNQSIRYVMVNEAGASIYSTSEVGREELPDFTPAIRSAVSIGRRLQDPMSELVKISPANIGVGMYQHDVRAKHLSASLDDVVQFCVNRVGVDANTASPSLLSYVSGLNALTARRLVEHRKEQGGFKNRSQLKEVSGVGDATFVQVAGFLRISGGDCPLDSTSIHPESYPIAEEIIKRVDATAEQLFPQEARFEVASATPAAKDKAADGGLAAQAGEVSATPEVAKADLPAADSTEPASTEPASSGPASTEPAKAEPTATDSTDVDVAAAEPVTPVAAETSSTEEAAPATTTADLPTGAAAETAATETTAAETTTVSDAESKPVSPPSRPKPSPELVAARKKRREIVERISKLELDNLSTEIPAGKLLLADIVRTMKRPDWDPREKTRKPVFRRGMLKTDELQQGMELEAQVVNVVDFGVFVDIGLGESCLVHVSQLSNRFIRDPQVVFAVGDVIRTWVTEIDVKKRRVKLTAIRPGTEKGKGQRGRRPARGGSGNERGAARGGGRKPNRGRDNKKRSDFKKSWKPKPKAPKPVTPITDDMLKGDAPMTSFSDLMQFVKKKPDNSDEQ
ncbi:helix-hairpin-helix domain-containing protein [Mariniblastus fucicola]|uniref:30S ribosomal protein S1 n=1 Tax=Mariniblastus fucicola TaxID=980251 RepID=A0A5B9PBW5_9BACT|nr:Tex-like N-terminal domain-containing protein [Mariniblastus fucicola]QEG20653.1 30S ribosomal protein S1 [Mariniblastus fucicola]